MDVERLTQLLASSDPDTRASAAQAAAESGNAASVRPLSVRLRVEPDPKVRRAILLALGKLGTPEGLGAIRGQAGDPDPKIRCRVIETLFRAQDQSVFPLAVRMLSDLDPEVKQLAFQVVKRLGRDGVMQIISKMLSSEDVRWRVYAVAALGQVASNEGVGLLARCLTNATPEVRLQARASLVNLAKHGNEAAGIALSQADGKSATSPDINSTLMTAPLKDLRPSAGPPPGNDTITLPAPGLSKPKDTEPLVPKASALAGPPPSGPPSASAVHKRPGSSADTKKSAFVPLDEESLKIRTKPPEPSKGKRRYSTAKYRALFGEEMPRETPPPAAEPEPELEPEMPEEEMPAEEEAAVEEDSSGVELNDDQKEQQRKKKSKHWKDNTCKDCVFVRKDRPDKEKLAPSKMYCSLVKKDVKMTFTCPRGKW